MYVFIKSFFTYLRKIIDIGAEVMNKTEEQNNVLVYKYADINILEKIKSSCHYVSTNSSYVLIDYEKLDEHIKTIDFQKVKFWLSSNPYNLFDMEFDKIINFLLIFDSIDYCFWGTPKWTIKTIEGEKDG